MNKVTSIKRNLYLGEYCDSQYLKRTPEGLSFAVGVLLTVGLPQIILSAYGGIATLMALAGATMIGAIAGLVLYRYMPYEMVRCIGAEMYAQSPPRKDKSLGKAA
jgi:hypothetical protein